MAWKKPTGQVGKYKESVQVATAERAQSRAPVKEIMGSIPGRSMDIHDTQKQINNNNNTNSCII